MYRLRLLLLPFGFIYGAVVEIIKYFYRTGLLKSKRTEIASIVVGNISVGGTGKTPHTEYLINYLWKFHKIAVLSRGYGRKTKGFRKVSTTDKAEESGDEPLQMAKKFPEVPFFVSEKRLVGIEKILQANPDTQLLILDDAMQHWPLKADSYLMITSWYKPFFNDFPLPAGNLREFRNAYKRAQIIIVSKCPIGINEHQKDAFLKHLNPMPSQKVFFSFFKYGNPYLFNKNNQTLALEQLESRRILLITGIANPEIIESELNAQGASVSRIRYADHHQFNSSDIKVILKKWEEISSESENCILMTTEKDATRLSELFPETLPLYVLPIKVEIAFDKAPEFQRALVEVMYKKKGYPSA